jgi:hypothetical protein
MFFAIQNNFPAEHTNSRPTNTQFANVDHLAGKRLQIG